MSSSQLSRFSDGMMVEVGRCLFIASGDDQWLLLIIQMSAIPA